MFLLNQALERERASHQNTNFSEEGRVLDLIRKRPRKADVLNAGRNREKRRKIVSPGRAACPRRKNRRIAQRKTQIHPEGTGMGS